MLDLVKTTADDRLTKVRVEKLQAAAADARQASAKAEKETQALDAKRLAHLKLMADEKEKFDQYMDARRDALEDEAKKKLADITEREAAVKRREEEVAALLKAHSERVAELDQKLSAIQRAAR